MNIKSLKLFLFLLYFAIPYNISGQQIKTISVTGKVLDSYNKEPVTAASISIEGAKSGAVSDDDGLFEIVLPSDKSCTVHITHINYSSYSFLVSPDRNLPFNLLVYLIPRNLELGTVLITGNHSHSKFEEIDNIKGTVEGVDLQKNLGLTLAATLKNETGLAIRSMGPAPARPVIRGLGGDRILFAEDGVKTTDLSATSPDHALTIEPFSITRADIIRGPKTILFSPVTIGGVVNVIRHDIPVEKSVGLSGSAGSYYESANNGLLYGGSAEYGIGSIVMHGSITTRKSSDMRTPTGNLKNSFSDATGLSAGASYVGDFGYTGYSYRSMEMDYGIPGGFVGAHPNGVRISIFRNVYSGKASFDFNSSLIHNATIHVNRSFYRHKEYERNDLIGAEFRITDYTGYLNFEHHLFGLNEDGVIGFSGQYRDFETGGFVFTPKSESKNLSFYFWQPFSYDGLSIEFGGRVGYDNLTPEKEKIANIGKIRERNFPTYSLALSGIYGLSEKLFVGINLSKSSRVPTIEELYSEGPHLAAYSYETGNPDLESESGLGLELFSYYKADNFYSLLNLYYYDINDFIIPRNTGKINYQTFLPVYSTQGVGATILGAEFQSEIKLSHAFTFLLKASFTQGRMVGGGNLPQIPPAKLFLEASYKLFEKSTLEVSAEMAASQEETDTFETPTEGYISINGIYHQSFVLGNLTGLLSIGVDNILDTEYKNHLSRVKSIMPETGRNLRTILKVYIF